LARPGEALRGGDRGPRRETACRLAPPLPRGVGVVARAGRFPGSGALGWLSLPKVPRRLPRSYDPVAERRGTTPSQWRDRAGLAPASLFSPRPATADTRSHPRRRVLE